MASRVVLLICILTIWEAGNVQAASSPANPSQLADVLTTLQKQHAPSSCDSLSLATQVLIREIEARVEQQSKLESRIEQMKNQLSSKQNGPVIAFSARVRDPQLGLVTEQTIPFQDIVTNIGGGYNGDTSTFRCPVRGLYQFIVTILSKPNDKIQTELIAAGISQMKIYSGGVTYFGSGSNSVLLQLEAGDAVYVRLLLSTGTQLHHHWSTFDGYLVRQL